MLGTDPNAPKHTSIVKLLCEIKVQIAELVGTEDQQVGSVNNGAKVYAPIP